MEVTEVKSMVIIHPKFGNIEVFNGLTEEDNKIIGERVSDYADEPYMYYGDISLNDDGTYNIIRLGVIKPGRVEVGSIKIGNTYTSSINVFKNIKLEEKLLMYPNGVVSVTVK